MRAALFFLLLLVSSSTSDAAEKYVSKDGRFAIALPEKAVVRVSNSDAGEMPGKTVTAESNGRRVTISYMKLPTPLPDADTKELLAALESSLTESEVGKRLSSKAIVVGKEKRPGRDVVLEKSGCKIRVRIVCSGTIFHMIMVDGPNDFVIGEEATSILDSFESSGEASEKHKSKEGRFAVAFPEGAEVKLIAVPVAGNQVMNVVRAEAKDRHYIVTYFEMPKVAKGATAKELLDGCEKEMIRRGEGMSYTFRSSKDYTHGTEKFLGREVVMERDGHKMRSRLILAGPRVYTILVGGEGDFAIDSDGTAFLNSFELSK